LAAVLVNGAVLSDDELVHFGLHVVHSTIWNSGHALNLDLNFVIGDVGVPAGVHLVVLSWIPLVVLTRRILVVLSGRTLVVLARIMLVVLSWIPLVVLARFDFEILP